MDIVISIASKIAESLVTPIGREFGYLIYYDTNMKDLKDQLKKLFEMKDVVQELVNAAERNCEDINSDVRSWLTSVDKLIQKVSHFEEEVNMKRRCLYRWNMSRKATKITEDVLHLQKEGTFNNVAHPAPPPMISSAFKEGFKDFKSRMTSVNRVIEVLKNEEVRMIGICGMGGVGKTTMVKEIIKRLEGLEGLKVFDSIVMAVVSQTPDIQKIQSEIAEELGLKYDENTESGRARRLHKRLMEINRILIVLDDVWTELDFEAIGLPSGLTHKGCKVLLTSRDLKVCNALGSQKNFTIPVLTPEESWELFCEIVGKPLDYPDLAKQVTNECAGLPLAILTVAKALENARKYEWDDALKQLKSSVWNNRVYSSIQWSYDRLESDEAKSCLLLCCLFPEDYDIPIEYLVRYGWGRGYFSNIDSVEEARNRVHSLVDKLQRRFLLLDSKLKDHTKMHDIVRDVAISIASRDPHRFLIRCDAEKKGWPKVYDHYTTISLIPINIDEIPVGLECPKLELLHLKGNCYWENSMDIVCEGMKELKVLGIGGISALPSSLGVLKSLRTLSLNGCRYLTDISDVIGRLENLEILSFRECVDILELPREIGLLKHLRLLDITGCYRLEKIPHGLLSSLSSLEELYMERSFRKWEQSAAESEDKRMASLVEVMSLLSNHLKVLVIDIPDFNFFPKDFYLTIQTTIRFHISNREEKRWFIGDSLPSTSNGCYAFENKLEILQSDATEFMEIQIVRLLFKKCEDLILEEIKNLKYVLNELDQEGLQHLKVLTIRECPEIEYLVNGASWIQQTAFPLIQSIQLIGMPKLKAICHDQLPQGFFINLRSLELRDCPVLKYAFSLSVASNLVQLQSLNVDRCRQMKEIVSKEWREDETAFVGFPKLTNLTLECLSDEFVGFYEANKLYSNHEVTTPKDQNVVGTSYDVHQSSRSFERAIFPSKCILWLQNLEEVTLAYANVDVLFDLKGHMVPAFSHLQKLVISLASRCQHLWKNIPRGFQGFQNLRHLKINYGTHLQYVFPHSIARLLVNLEELNIAECRKMETIVRSANENEKEDQTGMTLFPKLNSFDLKWLLSLESLCPDASTSLWSAAKVMSVVACHKLKTLASVIPQIKKLEKDSTAHHEDEDEDEGISSGSYGCTPYSCGPMTKPTSRRNVVQILPRPVNQEVAPTNLDQDSNDYDNLERLSVQSCMSLEVVFQLKAVESHNVQAFNKLCNLSLDELPSLMHVWETGSSQHITGFGNLTFLSVSSCGSLRYLFLSTVAKLLVSLKDLEVQNCEKIEQVIAKADTECADQEITFPRLNSIMLQYLPNLICFSTEAYTLKLPSLMELKVKRCPYFRTFASKVVNTHSVIQVHTELGKSEWMGDLNSTIGNIHEKRETQRSAEVTTPKDENVVGTSYDGHQSSRSFERAVFPSKCILWLQNLEEVTLEYANGIVDVLFDLKGHMVPAFSHLRKLEILLESPCQHLWKNIPRGFLGFQNLRYLKIGGGDLQYVLPHSIARLLVNLEELNIAHCMKMETIVRSADENEKEDQTLFPKLNSFHLKWLLSLESLCPDASTSLWSAAKVMSVVACHKLKTLASVIPQIKKLEKDSTAHHEDEDEDEGISSGSYGCTPYSCGPMTEPTSRRNIVQILPRPVNQEVAPTNLDQDSNDYDNLERLDVQSCMSLEVVFQLKGPKAVESHNAQAFNKLCNLSLFNLPSLMHVWEMGSSQHITGFGNLTFLSVSFCGSLRYLFLSTVANLLVSLKDLQVWNCEEIEQVIAKADTECADQEITFPRLNSIMLQYLPNLICFSTEAYTLKLPSLMTLTVERCPDLRTFASKVVNTHSVIQVYTELGKSEWMGDLNSTIGNIHEKRETQSVQSTLMRMFEEF